MGDLVCCFFGNCIFFVRSIIVPCLAKWIDSQVATGISRCWKRAVAFDWTLFLAIGGFNNRSDLTAADSYRHIFSLAVPSNEDLVGAAKLWPFAVPLESFQFRAVKCPSETLFLILSGPFPAWSETRKQFKLTSSRLTSPVIKVCQGIKAGCQTKISLRGLK